VFKAKLQPFTTRFARRHGLPLRLYCSRACDVRISLRVRRRGHLATLASYRRTETEIAKAHSTITLPLPRKLSIGVLRSAAARARLELVALDASGERHRVTLLIARAVR
jgi:hypothetical protein